MEAYTFEEIQAWHRQKLIDGMKIYYGENYTDITKYKQIPTLNAINDAMAVKIFGGESKYSSEQAIARAYNFLCRVGIIEQKNNYVHWHDAPFFSLDDVKNEARKRWAIKMQKGKEYMRNKETI